MIMILIMLMMVKISFFPDKHVLLVGGFNPVEKYARQIGSSAQVGVKLKYIWVATT